MNECPRCGLNLSDAGPTTPPLEVCPNCGLKLVQPSQPWETGTDFIKNYFSDVWKILTKPSSYFRKMPTTGGLSGPLCFALATHWVGSALSFIWKTLIGFQISNLFRSLFQIAGDIADTEHPGRGAQLVEFRERFVEWVFGAGPVILDPFLTLFSILFTSLLVFIGARILAPSNRSRTSTEITYESAVRIICYGMTPSLLAGIPLFGGFVSSLCIFIVTVIGIKEVYQITPGRSIVIALFPKLLFLGIIIMGIILFALAFFKFFLSLF